MELKIAKCTSCFANPDLSAKEYELLSSHMKRTLICAPQEQKESINSQWNTYKEKYTSFINRQKLNIESLEQKKKELQEKHAHSFEKAREYYFLVLPHHIDNENGVQFAFLTP